ncbi:MAG: AbrB/MazE/SpoVT family DNA-binding domain-containing protein [Methylococcales bacterium]
MQTTRLSSKGQVIILKTIRDAYHLSVGQELEIEITAQGILLKTINSLPKTTVSDLVSCTGYQGATKTVADMEAAVRQGVILNAQVVVFES